MQYDEELYRELDAAFPPREHVVPMVRPADLNRLAEAHQRAGEAQRRLNEAYGRAVEAAKRAAAAQRDTKTQITINGEEMRPAVPPLEWRDIREHIATQRAARIESQYRELRQQMKFDQLAVEGAIASGLSVEEVRRRLIEADELHTEMLRSEALRLIQADDIQAEAIRRIDTPVGRITADRFAAPPPPHEASPGERRLAEQMEAAGWVDVEVIPPRQHQYTNEDGTPIAGAVEVAGFDGPARDWRIYADGGSDGRIEGYWVTKLDDDEESERIPATKVPTPNDAVGAWETQRRAASEAARPRGRKA